MSNANETMKSNARTSKYSAGKRLLDALCISLEEIIYDNPELRDADEEKVQEVIDRICAGTWREGGGGRRFYVPSKEFSENRFGIDPRFLQGSRSVVPRDGTPTS